MDEKTRISIIKGGLLALLALFLIMGSWNVYEHITLIGPFREVAQNPDFKGIQADVHYAGFLNNKSIVFNIKKISDPAKLTTFELMAKFAQKMYEKQYDTVFLQYRGKTKYILDGREFAGLGVIMQIDPLEKIILDFPPKLKNPEGLPAFKQPYGEEQWVIQKKSKNFKDFLFTWYIDEWIIEAKKKGIKPSPDKATGEPIPAETKGVTEDIPEIDIDILPMTPDGNSPETTPGPVETQKVTPTPEPTKNPADVEIIDIPLIEPERF